MGASSEDRVGRVLVVRDAMNVTPVTAIAGRQDLLAGLSRYGLSGSLLRSAIKSSFPGKETIAETTSSVR